MTLSWLLQYFYFSSVVFKHSILTLGAHMCNFIKERGDTTFFCLKKRINSSTCNYVVPTTDMENPPFEFLSLNMHRSKFSFIHECTLCGHKILCMKYQRKYIVLFISSNIIITRTSSSRRNRHKYVTNCSGL